MRITALPHFVKKNTNQFMLIEPTYKGIFYDVSKPMTPHTAMHKSMGKKLFLDLTDGFEGKEVWLDGLQYKVKSTRIFSILSTIENTFYVVVDVQEIKHSVTVKIAGK